MLFRSDSVFVGRRDRAAKDKQSIPRAAFVAGIVKLLDEMQDGMLERARAYRAENTRQIDSKDEFYEFFTPQNSEKPEIHGGYALSHWSGDAEVEEQVRKDLQVTIRCVPQAGEFGHVEEEGRCVISGKPSSRRVIFAKAY